MSSVSPTEHSTSWEPQGDSAHWCPATATSGEADTCSRRQRDGTWTDSRQEDQEGEEDGLNSESDAREQDLGTSGSMPTVPQQLPLKRVI